MGTGWNREQLLELSRSFQLSRILLTAAELNLFDLLAAGPRSVEDLCSAGEMQPRGLTILLDALASQGLVSKSSQGMYYLEDTLAAKLTAHGAESVLPMIMHGCTMWQTWHNLTQIVRTGENPDHMDIGSRSTEDMDAFIGAMHVIGIKMAEGIAQSIDLTKFQRLLDVGGASGTYAMAFLRKAPHMTATIFDLPSVMDIARKRLSENNFADRIKLVAGDYDTDELPEGHDLVLLSAVIHSNSRQANRNLFRKIYRALKPGGALLIRDFVMDETRTLPPAGAIFAVNMLVATTGGNSYTFQEIRDDLAQAGLTSISKIREGANMDELVMAMKSS